jgi:hypothetical protein
MTDTTQTQARGGDGSSHSTRGSATTRGIPRYGMTVEEVLTKVFLW